ncbi:uncharacterized protein LOC102899478 isoform X4 [Felis catus]|uniref:uncharacterized protein LOC102899478 isoform X4 n=1 Tax=Felis catus TaxID=9685 RepID=UPI0009488170|nr:uncharacterized protein LOC102899478 isoform X4 [Felis catus]
MGLKELNPSRNLKEINCEYPGHAGQASLEETRLAFQNKSSNQDSQMSLVGGYPISQPVYTLAKQFSFLQLCLQGGIRTFMSLASLTCVACACAVPALGSLEPSGMCSTGCPKLPTWPPGQREPSS